MSYKLNKSDGTLLVDLVDGQVDTTSTDLTLVGRNYKGFGEFLNENYIRLLENFARTSAPSAPLTGQLWYDTAEQRLKIYTGETFRSASGAVVSQTQPNLVTGDLWVDSLNNKLYFFDGADIVLVGPQYTASQGKTAYVAETILDENGQDQTVLTLYINGQLAGISSRKQFRPRANITGYPIDPDDNRNPKRQIIRVGFNPVDIENYKFNGTAQTTRSLVSDSQEQFTEANFMKTDRNTSTTGSISIKNRSGLSVGNGDTEYLQIKIVANTTVLEAVRPDRDFAIRTTRGNSTDTPFYVDSNLKRVGILTESPSVNFDVDGDGRYTGNLEVEGNLTVNGDTTYINVTSLKVQDKNIELGTLDDSTVATDDQLDGAGIIVRSLDGDKTLTWEYETSNWTFNQDVDLVSGKSYKINNRTVLSSNRLSDDILYAEGIISLGTLNELTVGGSGTTTITDSTITTTQPLNLSSNGTITVNNQNITGVISPVNALDVANKQYVDEQIDSEPVVLTIDCTGFANPSADFSVSGGPYADVIDTLDFLFPAVEKEEDTVARVFCTSYFGTTVTGIDIDNSINKSYVSVYVDPEDSTTPQLESVLQDVDFTPITGNANLTPSRAKMEFVVRGGAWEWERTTPV